MSFLLSPSCTVGDLQTKIDGLEKTNLKLQEEVGGFLECFRTFQKYVWPVCIRTPFIPHIQPPTVRAQKNILQTLHTHTQTLTSQTYPHVLHIQNLLLSSLSSHLPCPFHCSPAPWLMEKTVPRPSQGSPPSHTPHFCCPLSPAWFLSPFSLGRG